MNNFNNQGNPNKTASDYEYLSKGPVKMDVLRSYYPDARLASPADAKERLLQMIIPAAVLILVGIVILLIHISKDSEQTRFLANAAKAEGSLSIILPTLQFPEMLLDEECNVIAYNYTYEGVKYKGSQIMNNSQISEITLVDSESGINDTEKSNKKKLQVYVDKNDPSSSRLTKDNSLRNGFLYFGIFIVAALIFTVAGIIRYNNCISLKTAVYTNSKNKKKYHKIQA